MRPKELVESRLLFLFKIFSSLMYDVHYKISHDENEFESFGYIGRPNFDYSGLRAANVVYGLYLCFAMQFMQLYVYLYGV